jgi:hypothetical protein
MNSEGAVSSTASTASTAGKRGWSSSATKRRKPGTVAETALPGCEGGSFTLELETQYHAALVLRKNPLSPQHPA